MSAEQKTTIDWLRFRVKAEPREIIESLVPMFGQGRLVGHGLALLPLDHGAMGWQQASAIAMGDMLIGRMDFGGESQRGWVRVEVPAKGCEWVKDWAGVEAVEALPSAEIRRLDIALTTWNGEITHEQVVQAHKDGRFTTRRPPHLRQITSTDPRAGRTCYIGKREKTDKFMRCYEKGFEMLAKMGRNPAPEDDLEGCKIEDIYRCEVELKAQNTAIPWEVIERRDQYFAGAYPFCADVLPGIEADILKRRPERDCQIALDMALENCLIQYGPTLFTALSAYGGDVFAVWDRIVARHHNKALLEAGVLLVDHE